MQKGELDDSELADDVVGVTSARLLAAGLPADRRRSALRLLGVLGSVADAEHRVRRPLAGVAGEFGLDLREATIALDDLVSVDVLRRGPDGFLLGGTEPAAMGGLRLQDFLALADDLEERRRSRSRTALVLRPAATVLAAAALLAAVLLAPGALRDRTTPVSSSGGPAHAGTSSTDTTGSPASPAGPAAHQPASAVTAGSAARVTSTTVAGPEAPCPAGSPILDVLGGTPDLNGNLLVDGVARNTTDHGQAIRSFMVRTAVDGRELSAPGTDGVLVVPAHATVDWTATLPVAAQPGTDLRAVLGEWEWQGPDVPPGCTAH